MIFPSEYTFVLSIAAIALMIWLTYSGYKEGFVVKFLEFFSTIICIVLAWQISGSLSEKIQIMPKEYVSISGTSIDGLFYHAVNESLIFLILFIIFRILIIFIRPMFKKLNWVPFLGLFNKIMGAIMGFLQSFLILGILVIVLSSPLFANGKQVLKDSNLVYINNAIKSIATLLTNEYSEMESIQKMQTASEIMENEDIENIKSWLNKYDFDDSEKEEIIEIIKMRSE